MPDLNICCRYHCSFFVFIFILRPEKDYQEKDYQEKGLSKKGLSKDHDDNDNDCNNARTIENNIRRER